jgi:hypothetical protein
MGGQSGRRITMDDAQEPAAGGGTTGSHLDDFDATVIERAVLNDSEEGRRIAASFVKVFGDYVTASVRPILVEVAESGAEPQLLVNGLAELLRSTAERIEFPLDHPRAGSPNLNADGSGSAATGDDAGA